MPFSDWYRSYFSYLFFRLELNKQEHCSSKSTQWQYLQQVKAPSSPILWTVRRIVCFVVWETQDGLEGKIPSLTTHLSLSPTSPWDPDEVKLCLSSVCNVFRRHCALYSQALNSGYVWFAGAE